MRPHRELAILKDLPRTLRGCGKSEVRVVEQQHLFHFRQRAAHCRQRARPNHGQIAQLYASRV
jgi:hypothetical protein